jgi:hypothetical protein
MLASFWRFLFVVKTSIQIIQIDALFMQIGDEDLSLI